MMPETEIRPPASSSMRPLTTKLTHDEMERACKAAADAGLPVRDWARRVIRRALTAVERRTWADEISKLQDLTPCEAGERFNVLRNGRTMPSGFGQWDWERRIAWMEKEWPL